MTVQPSQRFTRRDPCPVCGGGADLARGRGERCHGFASEDGRFAHCTREDARWRARGGRRRNYAHRLDGPCRCGTEHGTRAAIPPPGKLPVAMRPTQQPPREHLLSAAELCPAGFREARVYPWTDETGAVLYETVRYEHTTKTQAKKPGKPEKTFRVRRPAADRPGAYFPSRGDLPPVVFRKDRLAARPGDDLHWVEGEAHALALERLGLLATTTVGGAKGVRAYDAEELRRAARGRHVVLHADNDPDGEAYVDAVAHAITPGGRVRPCPPLSGLRPRRDVLDWIGAGGTADDLRRRTGDAAAWKPAATTGSARLIVTRLSDVVAKPIDWMWPGRLARGKLHLLGGDYGDGKSTLMAWLAAVLSTGAEWPDGGRAPASNVLFLLLEDAIDDTLKPRLALHGANEDRIFAIEAVAEGEGQRRVFNLDRHLDLLRGYVSEHPIDLIVIDPVSGFMQRSNRDGGGPVRDVLTPVVDLGNELDVAIMALMHTGKPGVGTVGRKATQRLLGSTAFPAVARVVWMLAPTPSDPKRKVLAVTKSNLSPKPAPLEWSRDLDRPLAWHGTSDHDIERLFDAIKPMPREEAKAWLREALAGGSVPQQVVEARARDLGISAATLKRAREDLGVESSKQPGVANGPWLWALRDAERRSPAETTGDGAPAPRAEADPSVASPTPRAATVPSNGHNSDSASKKLTSAEPELLRRWGNDVEAAHRPYTTLSLFDVGPVPTGPDPPRPATNRDEPWKKLIVPGPELVRSPREDVEDAQPSCANGERLRSVPALAGSHDFAIAGPPTGHGEAVSE